MNIFDDLDNKEQDIIIQIKYLVDDYPDLLSSDSINDYPTIPIGGDNPYHQCKYCKQSDPYISIEGHKNGCKWNRIYNNFELLKTQLPSSINIEEMLDELEY